MANFAKFYTAITTVLLIALAASCKSIEPPDFKTFISNAQKIEAIYCGDNFAAERAQLIAKIRERHPDYPDNGLCGFADPKPAEKLPALSDPIVIPSTAPAAG